MRKTLVEILQDVYVNLFCVSRSEEVSNTFSYVMNSMGGDEVVGDGARGGEGGGRGT